jgi:hypothetical protein
VNVVKENKNGSVVNAVTVVNESVSLIVVKNSSILAGGKAQSLLSQVVKVNIGNEDHGEVDVTMDNENANMVNVDSVSEGNPEQVLTGQVVGMVSVSEV